MGSIDGKKSEQKDVSRRGFLKGMAVLVGSGLVAGSDLNAGETKTPEAAETAASGSVAGYCGEGDWLGTPPVIADSQIIKTIEVDVLVLGGGHAGVLAALGASDKGAKVAVVEMKDETGFINASYWIGQDVGHVNSKWLISKGYGPYDTGEITAEFVKRANGRCNPQIISLFVENSGAMFDRMVEIYEGYAAQRKAEDSAVKFTYSDGVAETYDFSNIMSEKYLGHQVQKDRLPKDYPIVIGGYKTWPCTAQFQGPDVRRYGVMPMGGVLKWLEKYLVRKTRENNADWYYRHKAVVLVQDADGDVAGAIVQDESGKYLRFSARKGVIVATGDFSGNKDMFWALMNEVIERAERERGISKKDFVPPGAVFRNGGGHKMCCWAGGMIEPAPRGLMATGSIATKDFPWGMSPMLLLNAEAKRFANEAAAFPLGHIAFRQPPGNICLVTDKNYVKSIVIAGLEHGGPNFGRPEWVQDMQHDMVKVLAAGAKGWEVRNITLGGGLGQTVFGANSLEELAGYLGYTGDLIKTFIESIHRYNSLCNKGTDSDFGKEANAMIPVEEPPFYGCKNNHAGQKYGMPTLCGLMTDNKLRVVNKAWKPIKGLFVSGNTLGGRYGMGYSTPIAGNTIGMAMTHGWLAGKFAAES